jgi:4'-phosphopantetheinyl transferase
MGLALLKEFEYHTKLGVWKVEESIDELKNSLILNTEELDFYNSLNKGKRNLHWLSSRVLLRKLLNTDSFIEIRGDEHNKPHLINLDFEISISHSSDYAAVIVSKHKVGVDIEIISSKILRIHQKFLNNKELACLGTEDLVKKLYVYWCAKESLYKLYGKKEIHFRNNIIIEPFEYEEKGKVCGMIFRKGFMKKYSISYQEYDNYMLTWVIE